MSKEPPFAPYDLIAIINLPSRPDRRRAMLSQLSSVGLGNDRRVVFYDAIRAQDKGRFVNPGGHGCFQSHLMVLESAAQQDKSVLLLEDDCDFAPAAKSYAVPADCDIFYGGGDLSDPDDFERSNVIGAHCMGFSRSAAKIAATYLRDMLAPAFEPSVELYRPEDYDGHTLPLPDGAYVWLRRRYPDLRSHLATPPIAFQRSSSSDITPQRLDRIPGARRLLNPLRALRTKLRQS